MKSKQYAKRLLSLIIASVMILTMLPVSALASGADDVMIEDQAETIVEEAADVSGEVVEEAAEVPDIEESEDAAIVSESVDEIADADSEELAGITETRSLTAWGVKSGSKMRFDAKLTGLTVSAVVPTTRANKGSCMTADIVDVSAYEDAIAKKNYGKSIAGLYGLELHFYDKKGKEIKHINTSNITVTVDGLNSSYYFIGRIDNKVKKIQRGTEPTFTFTEKKAYTYVIAGLEDDGLLRATAETDSKGNKRFNLNEENVNIEVVAPKGAFADGVAMEASDVTNGAADGGDDTLVGASSDQILAAYEISFYDEEGAEQQPSKEVAVTINTPLDMTKSYKLIHIADNGTSNEVKDAKFSASGVEFTADSFSVYEVVWTDGEGNECSSTIHWSVYENESYTELQSPATIDSTASSVALNVLFEGYSYVSTVYLENAEATPQALSSPTLKKASDGTWYATIGGSQVTLADGSNIYVIYAPATGTPTTTPAPTDVPKPETQKTVTANDDGTYTIQLDITGHENQEIKQVGANVIVVMDVTQSMTTDMPKDNPSDPNVSRMAAAKSALNTLITTLNPDVNLINFTAVNFGNYHENNQGYYVEGVDWTTSKTAMQQYVTGLPNNPDQYGTCWQAGLQGAIDRADAAAASTNLKDNETYILFVTDGNPNAYYYWEEGSGGGGGGCGGGGGGTQGEWHYEQEGNGYFVQAAYDGARYNAQLLAQRNAHFYGIFVGDADGYDHLDNLVTEVNGVKTINGRTPSAIEDAFAEIASTVVENLGTGSVVVDDGIPSLSDVSASVTAGTAGGYEYLITPWDKENNQQGEQTTWTDAPGASYSNSNGVTWNLSSAGKLKDKWIYTLRFKVWPTQEAYDLIADLNNGLKTMTPDELEAAGIEKVSGVYRLKTNTHLYTTFKDDEGNEYKETNDWTPQAMDLPTSTIKVKKIWHNEIDNIAAEEVALEVTKDGADYKTVNMGVPVSTGTNEWEQTPKDEIYISVGNMGLNVNTNELEMHSTGHDYTVIEPPEFSYRWDLTADVYHPMIINNVLTVLIEVDEASGILPFKDSDGQSINIPSDAKNLANNKKATAGGYDFYRFGSKSKLYVKQPGENLLVAENDRRSNLIIHKVVDDESAPEDDAFPIQVELKNPNDPLPGEEGYSDHYHTMWFYVSTEQDKRDSMVIEEVTVEGATAETGVLSGAAYSNVVYHAADETYDFAYYTYTYNGKSYTARAADNGSGNKYYTGFYWFDNGGTATVYLKAGQYLNFNNLGRDTVYTIEEPTAKMPDGYTFVKAEASAKNKQAGQVSTPATVTGNKAEGTIDRSNTDYKVEYTNKYEGTFYVYHSSDCSVERFPMAEKGVPYSTDKTFDIYAKTAEGTLYGGYYSDYAGKSDGFDVTAAAALDYSKDKAPKDEDGTPYSYEYISTSKKKAWTYSKGYDVNGEEMVPAKGTVYYLKEVPDGYLRPYTHYTYFIGTGEIGKAWAITDTDDLCYSQAGFKVRIDDNLTATIVAKMIIAPANKSSSTVTLTAGKIFKPKGVLDGWLGYSEINQYMDGSKAVIQQYWKTKDGIDVFGVMQRELTFTADEEGRYTKSNITKKDTAYSAS